MRDYFIRRFLLIPPTLLGITVIVFFITRIVPGGPIERLMAESGMVDMAGGGSATAGENTALSEEQLDQLREFYGLDKPWYAAYWIWLGKVVQGNLGTSYRYQEPVMSLIWERMHISTYFGLVSMVVVYLVSLPLGILKAIKHRTMTDNVTSILVFTGYAVPGYALGALMVVYLCMRGEWFPKEGWPVEDFAGLSFFAKIVDLAHHTFLPLVCYILGSFALVTLLMKNHLMDNLAADYVRTAVAKGVSFKDSVVRHALRNSLIPLATTFGQNITLFVMGSFLIENIFDIDGIGLLGYISLLDRDYPVVLGILLLSAFLILLGNIISDALVAMVDPRVRFK